MKYRQNICVILVCVFGWIPSAHSDDFDNTLRKINASLVANEMIKMQLSCVGTSPEEQSLAGVICLAEMMDFVRKAYQDPGNPQYLLSAARYFRAQQQFRVALRLYEAVISDFVQYQYRWERSKSRSEIKELKSIIFAGRVVGKTQRLMHRLDQWLDE